MLRTFCLLLVMLITAGTATAEETPALGPDLQRFEYPFEVERTSLEMPRGSVSMAYMDVRPENANGRTVVLLHGKNFCGAYWKATIDALTEAGYRVIAPDQIGFCKSDKPEAYSYSFHQLAANTRALLSRLDVAQPVVLGHSMGGMLAVRFALMYPDFIHRLVLVNPIGLEDWKAKGVPYRGVPAWYQRELNKDYEAIKAYQKESYYFGDWNPAYARWAKMLAGMYAGEDVERVAWAQAMTYDMVYTQPVVHEFDKIEVPTTLMIGQRDRTALGKDLVSDELRATLGRYPELSRRAAERIPDAELIEFDGLGHLPHIEAPERFQQKLLEALKPRE
ncbi:alpha/beta fold hydrolase [Salinisphaera orenii]|uniref:alpha/beta fold hydrolase n=1 Tax=Salinisphaera orenii TaxID=856731 RepID=UPI000DBE2C07